MIQVELNLLSNKSLGIAIAAIVLIQVDGYAPFICLKQVKELVILELLRCSLCSKTEERFANTCSERRRKQFFFFRKCTVTITCTYLKMYPEREVSKQAAPLVQLLSEGVQERVVLCELYPVQNRVARS